MGSSESEIYRHCVQHVQELSDTDGLLLSPINLETTKLTAIELPILNWNNYDRLSKKMKVTNTSHTAILSGKWLQERPFLTSGCLRGNYVFSQLHFHWGRSDGEGSEHTVNGKRYPLEMHVVHFKADYLTQEQALKQRDGLVAIVYLFQIVDQPNSAMQYIIDTFNVIQKPHMSAHINPLSLLYFIHPVKNDYLMYWGSVTTSSCNHRILWIVSREPIGISSSQVACFRTLYGLSNTPLMSNFRAVQPLGKRSLFHVNPQNTNENIILSIPTTPYYEASQPAFHYNINTNDNNLQVIRHVSQEENDTFLCSVVLEAPSYPFTRTSVKMQDEITQVPSRALTESIIYSKVLVSFPPIDKWTQTSQAEHLDTSEFSVMPQRQHVPSEDKATQKPSLYWETVDHKEPNINCEVERKLSSYSSQPSMSIQSSDQSKQFTCATPSHPSTMTRPSIGIQQLSSCQPFTDFQSLAISRLPKIVRSEACSQQHPNYDKSINVYPSTGDPSSKITQSTSGTRHYWNSQPSVSIQLATGSQPFAGDQAPSDFPTSVDDYSCTNSDSSVATYTFKDSKLFANSQISINTIPSNVKTVDQQQEQKMKFVQVIHTATQVPSIPITNLFPINEDSRYTTPASLLMASNQLMEPEFKDKMSPPFTFQDTFTNFEFSTNLKSPVMIDPNLASYKRFPPLKFDNYWTTDGYATITNTGQTASIILHNCTMPTLSGGPLHHEYNFLEMHFLWGLSDDFGCEHFVKNKKFAMEVQLVHYSKDAQSIKEATKLPDGITVYAFFLQTTNSTNNDFQNIVSQLQKIKTANITMRLPENSLQWMKPIMNQPYFTYPGSLDIPIQSSMVTWIVCPQPISISHDQVNAFRQLLQEPRCIMRNIRDVQDLNNRPIYYTIQ